MIVPPCVVTTQGVSTYSQRKGILGFDDARLSDDGEFTATGSSLYIVDVGIVSFVVPSSPFGSADVAHFSAHPSSVPSFRLQCLSANRFQSCRIVEVGPQSENNCLLYAVAHAGHGNVSASLCCCNFRRTNVRTDDIYEQSIVITDLDFGST